VRIEGATTTERLGDIQENETKASKRRFVTTAKWSAASSVAIPPFHNQSFQQSKTAVFQWRTSVFIPNARYKEKTPMKRRKTFEPYGPSSRTQNGYMSILIDDSTLITLTELSQCTGLPKDSIVRAGIDLAIDRYGTASIDVHDLMKRSARHHKPNDPIFWGVGDHERERKATLPKGAQSLKPIDVKESESQLAKEQFEDLEEMDKWPVVINPKFKICENTRCGRKLAVDHVTLVTTAHVRRFCCVECIHEGQQAVYDYIAATVEREVKGK